jgi:phospholipase/carboxylesterase
MDLLYAAHVPPGDGPFPTILMLHGWGASGHDLLGLAPIVHGGEALVLCPQGPVAFQIAPEQAPGLLGYGWWPITPDREIDDTAFDAARQAVKGFLDEAVERYPVDPRKLVVIGFSQGGVMAYDLVLSDPGRFAGLVALSTWMPEHVDAAIPAQDALENFPALVIHGTKDPMIPVENAQESRQRLLARGVNVQYREFEMEHEISQDALRELVIWLEEKIFNLIQLA